MWRSPYVLAYRLCVFTVEHNYILFEAEQQRITYTKTCYYTFYVWIIHHNEFTLDIFIYMIPVYCFSFSLTSSPSPFKQAVFTYTRKLCLSIPKSTLPLLLLLARVWFCKPKINVVRCTIKAENCVKCHIRGFRSICCAWHWVKGFCRRAFVTNTRDVNLV